LIKDVNDKEIFNIKMRGKSLSFDPLEEEQAAYPVTVNNTEVWYKRLGHFHRAAVEEQCTISLDHYATNALNNVDSTMKRASSMYSKEMDQWFSSSEALKVKKMELEIESQFMNEAHLELNNTIEHSIKNDRKEREILCKRKNVLMGELNQLFALVKQNETEIVQ